MKKTGIILGLMVLCSFATKAQRSTRKWDGYVLDVVRTYKIEAGKPEKKETYLFKKYKDREEAIKVAYDKSKKKMSNTNCRQEQFEKEKKGSVNLMTGKVEESADA